MGDVQFEGENTYAPSARQTASNSGNSFLKRLAMKMGAKDDSQVQMVLLGISITAIILTIIVLTI